MIWIIIVTIILWVAAILMLTGRGSFLIAGYNTSGKEGRRIAREEYDIPKITKYLGKMIMLPLAIIFTAVLVVGLLGLDVNKMNAIGPPGLSIAIGLVITFGMFGYIMYVVAKVVSAFHKNEKTKK